MKRVVIIGGGISGLSTALYLKEQAASAGHEIDCLLIEKGSRLGGNILTEKVDGFLIEGGPDCFLSEKPWAAQLCRHLGLGDQIMPTTEENKGTFVLSKGRLHEMPDGLILMVPTKIMPLITTSLFSWLGKLRMGFEIFIPPRHSKEDETLGSFVRRRLGNEALDKIAEPLVAGVHAGDPETMSMRASFPKFMEMEDEHGSLVKGMLARMKKAKEVQRASSGPRPTMFMTLKGGLSEMINAIVSRLGSSSIKLNTSVSRVEEKGGKYFLTMEAGGAIEADSVIFSTPAYISSWLLVELDNPLSEKLQTIPYVSTATVTLAFKASEAKLPKSFGFVIPRVEERKIMAATFTSRKFAGRCSDEYVMIRCFVGGSKNEYLVALDDKEMVDMVRGELKDIIGLNAEPVLSRVYRWRKAMPQYTIGHLERVRWISERVHQHPGLYLTGSAYNGIGISDSIREGEITAKKCLDYLFQKDAQA
ncbi:MAG: oxygen-dependent protoporphyrinogen oxidase [Deltaproteobacteria bacterium]|nr:oxygen-dependent protoporphyrinogen oxidase [Deltaproteobacteria bacterium]